jgi:hypothetical protein
MYTVTLEVWLQHDQYPADQIPETFRRSKVIETMGVEHTVLERHLQLPFPPYPGLTLWLGDATDPHQDETQIASVSYYEAAKTFVCRVHPRGVPSATFEQLAENYINCGWKLRRL